MKEITLLWATLLGQSFVWVDMNQKSCMSTEVQVVKQVIQNQSLQSGDEDHPLAFWVHWNQMCAQTQLAAS